jgi:hypothetical protein
MTRYYREKRRKEREAKVRWCEKRDRRHSGCGRAKERSSVSEVLPTSVVAQLDALGQAWLAGAPPSITIDKEILLSLCINWIPR